MYGDNTQYSGKDVVLLRKAFVRVYLSQLEYIT